MALSSPVRGTSGESNCHLRIGTTRSRRPSPIQPESRRLNFAGSLFHTSAAGADLHAQHADVCVVIRGLFSRAHEYPYANHRYPASTMLATSIVSVTAR